MALQQPPAYLAIGHVTVDLTPDGTPALGGTALYAALQAARFGLHAAILTRGNFQEHGEAINRALSAVAAEVELIVQTADHPTVFTNRTVAGRRQQTIHRWAGPIDLSGLPPTWRSADIIHLAPVAQEIEPRQASGLSPGYFGTTPQGWMRAWQPGRGLVSLSPLRLPPSLLSRIDALVVNAEEHTLSREAIDVVAARGLAAVTRGANGAQLIDRGRVIDVPAFPVPVVSDVGAGDVFAAVLFAMRAHHEATTLAGRTAAAAAALKVAHPGPEGVATRAEVEAFLAEASRRAARRRRT